jgi:acetylornithine deacetylase
MDGLTDSSIDLLRRLVGFDTTSRKSNLELIDFVRDWLDRHRIESQLVFDDTGRKANLYATIGPPEVGGIMLSGHTDVVPIDGQDWHTDPFLLTAREGKLFGRGAADMKSFIAVALAHLPGSASRPLRTPIHIALSYDEEVGCRGVRRLIAALPDRPARPRMCIVGEPTSMQPVVGHKGKRSFHCTVHGFECHSSMTHFGVNAVEVAAEMVAELRAMGRRKREGGPFDADYEPPYTTIHTGMIAGGTALNIVPKECSFDFEYRLLPGDAADGPIAELRAFVEHRLLPEMRAVRPEASIELAELSGFPGLAIAPDAEVSRLVLSLTGTNRTAKVAFGTEAGLFQQAGIPTVVCGPGSIEQAHKPDEFIEIDQIQRCEAFIARLFDRAAA